MKRIHSSKKELGLGFYPKIIRITGIVDVGLWILGPIFEKVSLGRSGTKHFLGDLFKKVYQKVSHSHFYQT
jgi:hypothetical protein